MDNGRYTSAYLHADSRIMLFIDLMDWNQCNGRANGYITHCHCLMIPWEVAFQFIVKAWGIDINEALYLDKVGQL